MIDIQGVSFGYGEQSVLQNITACMENGQVTGLIGPNGAGKSTLFRLCARLISPQKGRILVDGTQGGSARAFARKLSFLPQHRPVPAVTVEALVGMGRYAHGKGDDRAVHGALQTVGLSGMAGRDVRTLSGGQRQMAYLAMLLAQESPNVLLDEPLTHLDIGAQLDVAQVIRHMKNDGKCVSVVVHDLNMLERVCDRVLLLDKGGILFDGAPKDCLQSQALRSAFGVKVWENRGISFEKS